MRAQRLVDVVAVVAGVGAAFATEVFIYRKLSERTRLAAASAGLVTAGLVYPAFRRRPHNGRPATIEWLAVGAIMTASLLSARMPRRQGTALVAAGWASHAAFDVLHGPRRDPRIPGWYPALCAGYDVAVAGLLLALGGEEAEPDDDKASEKHDSAVTRHHLE